jgi:hypothetical protein
MQFSIMPMKGVNQIQFDMTPIEVRALMPSEPRSFMRAPQDPHPTDYFEAEGAFFYYDAGGHLEAVEFTLPAQPTIANLNLLGFKFGEALAALSNLDTQVRKQVDGAIAYQLGISIYAPLAKDDATAPVETVVAFRPGYYN